MASVRITLTDTPTGGVEVSTDFAPTVGAPCSKAQSAALEIFNRTRKEWAAAGIEVVHINTSKAEGAQA
jgi:hypothetical protein